MRDPAGGDSFEVSINKAISKSALVKRPSTSGDGHLRWFDGSLIGENSPPPLQFVFDYGKEVEPFYRGERKEEGQRFTEPGMRGEGYRSVYESVERALRLTPGLEYPPELVSSDGKHHFLIPSFFHTICKLKEYGKSFSLVIRTFGSDAPDVASALNIFAKGLHPDFPMACPELEVTDKNMWKGRYDKNSGQFCLFSSVGTIKLDEGAALTTMQDSPVSVCQDDYPHWRNNNWKPEAGKPVWFTKASSCDFQHIFFDDNVKPRPDDSIIATRIRDDASEPFKTLSGSESMAYYGFLYHKAFPVKAITERDWFLERIAESINLAKKFY